MKEDFLGIAEKCVGKTVKLQFTNGRQYMGMAPCLVKEVGADYIKVRCEQISRTEDVLVNPSVIAYMSVPEGI